MKLQITLLEETIKSLLGEFKAIMQKDSVMHLFLCAKELSSGFSQSQATVVSGSTQLVKVFPVKGSSEKPVAVLVKAEEFLSTVSNAAAFKEDVIVTFEDSKYTVSTAKKRCNIRLAYASQSIVPIKADFNSALIIGKIATQEFLSLLNDGGYCTSTQDKCDRVTLSFRPGKGEVRCYSTDKFSVAVSNAKMSFATGAMKKASANAEGGAEAETYESRLQKVCEELKDENKRAVDYRIAFPSSGLNPIKAILLGTKASESRITVMSNYISIQTDSSALTVGLCPEVLSIFRTAVDKMWETSPVMNCQVDSDDVKKALTILLPYAGSEALILRFKSEKQLLLEVAGQKVVVPVLGFNGDNLVMSMKAAIVSDNIRRSGNIVFRGFTENIAPNGQNSAPLFVAAGSIDGEITSGTFQWPYYEVSKVEEEASEVEASASEESEDVSDTSSVEDDSAEE